MNTNLLLRKLYNDPKTGFVGAEKLLRRAKEYNTRITMKQVKEFLELDPLHQVFQKPKSSKQEPKIHGKIGHYQTDLTFLTRYKKHNNDYHILLVVINVNTKFCYVEALKDKTQSSILGSLENIRRTAIKDGRPINVLQSDNGKEFRNAAVRNWATRFNIEQHFCEKDNKKCLGVAERFNRTIKFMIEMYLTKANSNRWIDELEAFVANYNSAYHSSIKSIPERLEIFDEIDLIRASIEHNLKIKDSEIRKGDHVRLLNKRGVFEKEGQRFTGKIYLVEKVGLNSVRVQGKDNKFSFSEILKVSPESDEIDDSLRKQQLRMFKDDKRLREREKLPKGRKRARY